VTALSWDVLKGEVATLIEEAAHNDRECRIEQEGHYKEEKGNDA